MSNPPLVKDKNDFPLEENQPKKMSVKITSNDLDCKDDEKDFGDGDTRVVSSKFFLDLITQRLSRQNLDVVRDKTKQLLEIISFEFHYSISFEFQEEIFSMAYFDNEIYDRIECNLGGGEFHRSEQFDQGPSLPFRANYSLLTNNIVLFFEKADGFAQACYNFSLDFTIIQIGEKQVDLKTYIQNAFKLLDK